jgi:uncharacterized membrane protein YqaE (UPF0057 family)
LDSYLPGYERRKTNEETWKDRARGVVVDFLRILLSILVPPLGVFWQVGLTRQFWLNVLLTILGYIPRLAHAVYIILTSR